MHAVVERPEGIPCLSRLLNLTVMDKTRVPLMPIGGASPSCDEGGVTVVTCSIVKVSCVNASGERCDQHQGWKNFLQ